MDESKKVNLNPPSHFFLLKNFFLSPFVFLQVAEDLVIIVLMKEWCSLSQYMTWMFLRIFLIQKLPFTFTLKIVALERNTTVAVTVIKLFT